MRTLARRGTYAFLATFLLVASLFRAAVAWLPYPQDIDRLPTPGTFIQDRDGAPLAALVSPDGQWQLPLRRDEISPHLLSAIVAVEDARFQTHHGIDWRSVAGSLAADLRHLGVRRGGSTLTMQLQRLREPRPRTLLNKLDQAIRAEQLEKQLTKDQILVEYLNRAPFGGNLVGAGAASWRYFGRPCRDLSLAQSALLAGLPQSPNRLRPDRHPDAARHRRDHVLDRMFACGFITRPQFDNAKAEPITAAWRPLPQDENLGAMPTFSELATRFPGQSVRATLDLSTQRQAFRATTAHLATLTPSGVSAVAVVVLDTPTSACLASVSVTANSHGFARGVDLTRAARSSGSTLKPLIYAAAFDAGICTPSTTLRDEPAAWPGYRPGNYDGTFRGPIAATDALAESRNVPALVLLEKVGVHRAVGVMDAFGLRSISRANRDYGLSLAIGGAEVTPTELAAAYATLARGGVARDTSLLPTSATDGPRVLRPDACFDALRALSADARTRAVSPAAAGRGVAWKTGTSSGHRDAWCAAVTPRRTVVVWLGNPAGEGSSALVGQEAAAPLALDLIATLDPGGPGWPADAKPSHSLPVRPVPAIPRLVIASPSPNQRIVLSPDLRAEDQQVRLELSGSADSNVWWFIDATPIARGQTAWWSPIAGSHEVRAVDATGTAATIRVIVQTSQTLAEAGR